MPPISLYVHIPFCSRKCRYCDFYSIPADSDSIDRFIDALLLEWKLRQEALGEVSLSTIYIGGGTPSHLSPKQWQRLGSGLVRGVNTDTLQEWSVECNPDSFSPDRAQGWLDVGVTRVTFGIQSLNDRELTLLGRLHTAARARDVLADPILNRFSSIGADVMYGLPGQNLNTLESTICGILDSGPVKHLSAYELTLYPDTPLGRHQRLIPLPPEERTAEMYYRIGELCATRGLMRYEVSNLCLPGHESRHNRAYWNHDPYVGLGPAAHSFIPPRRSGNVPDLDRYLSMLQQGHLRVDCTETLDGAAMAREMVFLGLRTTNGIDTREYRRIAGREFAQCKEEALERMIAGGFLTRDEYRIRPTERGMLFADGMSRELM